VRTFEPELGQMLFSNGQQGAYQVPGYVEAGLVALGTMVATTLCVDGSEEEMWCHNPCNNVGGNDANFENDVFAMRAYCWCDGEREGHEDGCPPNFESAGLKVSWYKHARRGNSADREITAAQWQTIFTRCLNSLAGAGAGA
jgi:hypothetical protein